MRNQCLEITEEELKALVDFFGTLLEWSGVKIGIEESHVRSMYYCEQSIKS